MQPLNVHSSTRHESYMGKVVTSITLVNRADQILADNQVIAPEQIRSITIDDALVDTGATTLCLPAEVIASLGLSLLKEVDVTTAMGISKASVFRDATLMLCGRESTFECLELPEGSTALIGVIPLEAMGLEPDLQKQVLRVLPSESANTYITIL